jgi:hypothetical protein
MENLVQKEQSDRIVFEIMREPLIFQGFFFLPFG